MRVIALSEIATIRGGGRLGLSGKDFVKSGYPAYGAGGMNGYVATADHEGPAIILSSIGARCGKCFLVDGKWTSLANTQVIFPDPAVADTSFLWYQLNDENSWHRSGTGQPFIKPSDVKRRLVTLPSLEEQRRIAAILDQAGAVRNQAKQALASLGELRSACFWKIFGNSVTSARWTKVALGDLAADERNAIVDGPFGSSLKGDDYRSTGVPVIRIKNVTGDGAFRKDNLLFIDNEKFTALSRSRVRPDDVLVTRVGTLGNCCIYPNGEPDALLSTTGVCKITANRQLIVPAFLHAAICTREFQQQISVSASTSVQRYFNLSRLKAWRIILPPLMEQRMFVAYLEAVISRERVMRKRLVLAKTLFDSLHARAFRGEL